MHFAVIHLYVGIPTARRLQITAKACSDVPWPDDVYYFRAPRPVPSKDPKVPVLLTTAYSHTKSPDRFRAIGSRSCLLALKACAWMDIYLFGARASGNKIVRLTQADVRNQSRRMR